MKLRAEGVEVAQRLVEDAGVAGITFHPRTVKVRHKGTPDYDLAAQLVQDLPVPVIVTGGMDGPDHVRWVFEHTGCEAVMLARGSLGNPWLFEQVLGVRDGEPSREEILEEWAWVVDRGEEHLGADRAARYLRKFHPWYLERLGSARAVQDGLQRAETLAEQREIIAESRCYHARPRSLSERIPLVRQVRAFSFSGPHPKDDDMQKDVILTPEGLEKLKQEIETLSTDKRREVAARIKEAREFGDISENSEYDDAKNEQAMLEARIASLEDKLRSASVIDATELSSDIVRVGSVVNVKDEGSGKSLQYTIVGSTEADPGENRLSNESPVGKALLGNKRGDVVKVTLPSGKARELKITKIDVAKK